MTPERLAEIREYARVCYSGPISRESDAGRALNDALAEIAAMTKDLEKAYGELGWRAEVTAAMCKICLDVGCERCQ